MEKKKRKWYQRISSYFLILIFLIVLLILTFSLVILIKTKKNPDKIPDIFGYKPMIVLSGSMEKEIYAGDLAVVKMIDPEKLKVGDIIAFRVKEDITTTHRIIAVVEKDGEMYFETKGDNNNTNDKNLVGYANVEGIYLYKIPGFGNVFTFIQKPLGLTVTLLSIFVIGIAFLYLDSRKKYSPEELKEFQEFKKQKEKSED